MQGLKKGLSVCAAAAVLSIAVVPSQAYAQTPVTGTYELVAVQGDSLPATVDRSDDCTEEVTSARLVLDENGGWQIEINEQKTCGTEVEQGTEKEEGEYTVAGDSIKFTTDEADADADDAEEIDIDELLAGVVQGGELHVRLEESDAVLVFRKV